VPAVANKSAQKIVLSLYLMGSSAYQYAHLQKDIKTQL
jgi:hypothetical protein